MAMFGLTDTWKVTLLGDTRRGELLVPLAFVQANVLREYCSFQKLHVGFRSFASYEEGFEVSIRKIENHYEIIIDTAIVYDEREKSKIDTFIVPLVLFSDGNAAWWYNYYNNNLAAIGRASSSRGLVPIYNGRSQQGEKNALVFSGSWAVNPIVGSAGTDYLGGVNFNEVAFFASGSSIYGRSGDDGWLAVVLNSEPVIAMSGAQSNLFGVITKVSSDWNLVNSSELITINPATNAAANKWIWTPNFYRKTPGNGTSRNGWFYGKRDVSPYDVYYNLLSATVDFKGLLDCRYVSSTMLYKHGYAEMVTSYLIDDDSGNETPTDVADLYIFASPTPLYVPTRDYEYYQVDRITQNGSNASATMGDLGLGAEYAARIILDVTKYQNADVDMWSFASWENEDALLYIGPTGAIGIAVVADSNATFYRWKGSLIEVYTTTNYHSHIISRDGSILCVLEGSTSLVESIRVFDIYGERENEAPYRDSDKYAHGGVTELRYDDVKVLAIEAVTSCVIPYRADDFEPAELNKTTGVLSYSDATAQMPSLVSMAFPTTGRGSLVMQKIIIKDGVNASFGVYQDSCFDSKIYVEDSSETTEHLIAKSGKVKEWTGDFSMRGDFSEEPMRFQGIGDPEHIITLPSTFTIGEWESGGYYFEGYVGDLVYGSGFDSEGNADNSTAGADCAEYALVRTASSTCGQTAKLLEPAGPLDLTGDDTPSGGETYYVTGGIPSYSWSITGGGSLTEASDGLSAVIDVTGGDGSGVITVTDACGLEVTLAIRYPIGQWCWISYCACPSLPSSCTSQRTCTEYSGIEKRISYFACCSSVGGCVTASRECATLLDCATTGWAPYNVLYRRNFYEWHATTYSCPPGQIILPYPCT